MKQITNKYKLFKDQKKDLYLSKSFFFPFYIVDDHTSNFEINNTRLKLVELCLSWDVRKSDYCYTERIKHYLEVVRKCWIFTFRLTSGRTSTTKRHIPWAIWALAQSDNIIFVGPNNDEIG